MSFQYFCLTTKSCYNALGQLVLQERPGFGGATLKTVYAYNTKGQLESETRLVQGGVVLEGSLKGTVGAELMVFSPGVVSADINANVGGKVWGELMINREGLFISGFKSEFSGVKLDMKFTTLCGKLKFNRSWTIVDKSVITKGTSVKVFPR